MCCTCQLRDLLHCLGGVSGLLLLVMLSASCIQAQTFGQAACASLPTAELIALVAIMLDQAQCIWQSLGE